MPYDSGVQTGPAGKDFRVQILSSNAFRLSYDGDVLFTIGYGVQSASFARQLRHTITVYNTSNDAICTSREIFPNDGNLEIGVELVPIGAFNPVDPLVRIRLDDAANGEFTEPEAEFLEAMLVTAGM